VVESGDLAVSMIPSSPTLQLEAVADSLKKMGYTAVGVGPMDIRFGENYYKVLKARGVPIVHADIVEHDGALPYLVKLIDGVKVGVVSFGGVPSERKNSFELIKQRYRAFMEARRSSDVLVLLDQANVATDDWLQRNGTRFGSPDVVIGGATRASVPGSKQVGQTMVVQTNTMGQYVGRIDIDITATERKMTCSRQLLDQSIADDPDVLKIVREYYSRGTASVSSGSLPGTYTGTFHSYETCTGCHKPEYEQWKTTKHAMALRTLLEKGKAVADCLPCHSEQYKRTMRVVIREGQAGSVECESCHSNVIPHTVDYRRKGDTAAIRGTCPTCHTKERSPDFDPAAYYKRVEHTSK